MIRKISLGVMMLFVGAEAGAIQAKCAGCSIGKEKLQCDYYVERKGDLSRQKTCLAYAKHVDIDGAYPKAAWYYLLAGEFAKAEASARKALTQGQAYGGEYLAISLWAQGKEKAARKVLNRFLREVPRHDYLGKDLKTMEMLYPKKRIRELVK